MSGEGTQMVSTLLKGGVGGEKFYPVLRRKRHKKFHWWAIGALNTAKGEAKEVLHLWKGGEK